LHEEADERPAPRPLPPPPPPQLRTFDGLPLLVGTITKAP
jgi:hypothetical protein